MSLTLSGDGTLTGVDPVLSGFGKTLQIVQTVKTDTFTTSSTSYVAVTGLSASITPTSATSKILVIVTLNAANTSTGDNSLFRLMRGATSIAEGAGGYALYVRETNTAQLTNATLSYLDSPATTSSTTYAVDAAANNGTVTVNRRGADTSGAGTSTITLIEVAA